MINMMSFITNKTKFMLPMTSVDKEKNQNLNEKDTVEANGASNVPAT